MSYPHNCTALKKSFTSQFFLPTCSWLGSRDVPPRAGDCHHNYFKNGYSTRSMGVPSNQAEPPFVVLRANHTLSPLLVYHLRCFTFSLSYIHTRARTHTHTHTLSPSLSVTHTHTHTSEPAWSESERLRRSTQITGVIRRGGFALIIEILQFWMNWQMQSGRCCCPGGSTPQQFYRRRSFEVDQFCMGELQSLQKTTGKKCQATSCLGPHCILSFCRLSTWVPIGGGGRERQTEGERSHCCRSSCKVFRLVLVNMLSWSRPKTFVYPSHDEHFSSIEHVWYGKSTIKNSSSVSPAIFLGWGGGWACVCVWVGGRGGRFFVYVTVC